MASRWTRDEYGAYVLRTDARHLRKIRIARLSGKGLVGYSESAGAQWVVQPAGEEFSDLASAKRRVERFLGKAGVDLTSVGEEGLLRVRHPEYGSGNVLVSKPGFPKAKVLFDDGMTRRVQKCDLTAE